MYRTMLVPLDGSPTGVHALTLAWNIARRSGAGLRLVHVHTPADIIYIRGMPVIDDQLRAQSRAHERAYLQEIADRLMAQAPIPVSWSNPDRGDSIAGTLAREAATHGDSLMVMTTHGRQGLEYAIYGSVAEELIYLSPVPVLALRCSETTTVTELPPEPRILVPLDGSRVAEAILEQALALGRPLGAHYTLLRVVSPVAGGLLARYASYDVAATDADQNRAQAYLEHLARRLRADGLQVVTQVRLAEHPAEAILCDAKIYGCNLIAMATHARRGFSWLRSSSVATAVLRESPLPVLIYRPRVRVDAVEGHREPIVALNMLAFQLQG